MAMLVITRGYMSIEAFPSQVSSPCTKATQAWVDMDRISLHSNHSRGLHMAVCQNLVPLVNIKIAGKWMFIPLKMYL